MDLPREELSGLTCNMLLHLDIAILRSASWLSFQDKFPILLETFRRVVASYVLLALMDCAGVGET
jgi:hypothetical protein